MYYTIVSIVPIIISESKPGQIPDLFELAACKNDNEPSILRIKRGIDKRFVGGDFGVIDVPIAVEDIAKSIVMDYRVASPFATENAYPGLYALEGTPPVSQITASIEHKQACNAQMLWFMKLVKEADDIWQKNKQHKFINDIMRIAASRLNLQKEWNVAQEDIKTVKCIACQQFISSAAVICPHCHVVLDEKKYAGMQFANVGAAARKSA